jgi:acetyl-CoA C-acetyltransferase
MLGYLQSAIAGGMESMDRAPYLMSSGRWGYRMGDGQLFDAMLMDGLNDAFSGQHRAGTPKTLHARTRLRATSRTAGPNAHRSVSRRRNWQVSSLRKSLPSKSFPARGPVKFEKDEHNRPDTTAESLSKLKPAFRKDGTITAGNAPGLNSGAAAMVVADRAWAEKKGIEPMARLVSYGIGPVEPGMFGLGPVPAVKQALQRAGWKTGDVQRIEINEAFAAITMAVTKDLGLSEDVVMLKEEPSPMVILSAPVERS